MTKFFKWFFDNWRIPILVWFLLVGFSIINEIIDPGNGNLFGDVCFCLIFISIVGLIISAVRQSRRNHTMPLVLTVISLVLSFLGLIIFLIYGFLLSFGPDHYADNLKIPGNISIDTPIDLNHGNQKRLAPEKKDKVDFQLYKTFQSGCYEFDFWTSKIDSGTIYIKVFEITNEDELSDDTFPRIKIENQTDSIRCFGTTGYFVIYEGDWEKKYAARFEVWFSPKTGNDDYKLFSKNYIIDGWQH